MPSTTAPQEDAIESIVTMRLAAMRAHPYYIGGERAHEAMTRYVSSAVQLARHAGTSEMFSSQGRCRAHLTLWREAVGWHGMPAQFCIMDHVLGDNEAAAWIAQRFHEHAAEFTEDFELTLNAAYPHLIRQACDLGLGLDSISLVGDTPTAFAALQAPDDGFARAGLTVRDMKREDIDTVIDLEKQTISANPQFCWFGASDGYLAQERARLDRIWNEGAPDIRRVLTNRAGEIVGYCGATVDDTPYWGLCGGMILVLAVDLQSKGLARPAYKDLLERMLQGGVQRFKGGTSQPGVMKLSKVMGRKLITAVFRKKSAFPPSHFSEWLDPGTAPRKTT